MSLSTLTPALSEAEKAAITQDVLQAVKPMFAAAERMDPAWVLTFCQDTPEFQISWASGQTTDFAAADRTWRDLAARFTAQSCQVFSQKIQVLAADAVLHTWQGRTELTRQDGGRVCFDPFSETALLRKVGSTWKLASRFDSGTPTPMASPPVPGHGQVQLWGGVV